MQLILGGARSGKSRLAEQIAKDSNLNVTYIATAQAFDHEMQARIDHHQAQRPGHWTVIEEPLYLADCLIELDQPNQLILVDCLTLWMSNLLMHENAELQMQQCQKLLDILPILQAEVILVSNETGLGVIRWVKLAVNLSMNQGVYTNSWGKLPKKLYFVLRVFP